MSKIHQEFELQVKKPTSADDMRQAFPGVAAAVDEMKAQFGDGARVVAFEEGGTVVTSKQYKPVSAYGGSVTPSQYIHLGRLDVELVALIRKREGKR